MSRFRFVLVALLMHATLVACAPSVFVTQWGDYEYPGGITQVLVISDAEDRRGHEEEVVGWLHRAGVAATMGADFLPADALESEDKLRPRVEQGGFDGVMLTRVISEDAQRDGPREAEGLYDFMHQDPGEAESSARASQGRVGLEIRVYDVVSSRLVWSGSTEVVEREQLPELAKKSYRSTVRALAAMGIFTGTNVDVTDERDGF